MAVNRDQLDQWKWDTAQSVDMYNDWFMQFAPEAYRTTRAQTAKDIEVTLESTRHVHTHVSRALPFSRCQTAVSGQVGSTHGELSHHATVLMLQNVAVIHIGVSLGCRMIETHDNLRPVVVIQHHHVFPASLIRGRR